MLLSRDGTVGTIRLISTTHGDVCAGNLQIILQRTGGLLERRSLRLVDQRRFCDAGDNQKSAVVGVLHDAAACAAPEEPGLQVSLGRSKRPPHP